MIKNCNILINNDAVTVVRFNDVDVQLPSIHRSAKTVRVCYSDGKYFVVDDGYIEPEFSEVEKKPMKRRAKKTTIEMREILDAE